MSSKKHHLFLTDSDSKFDTNSEFGSIHHPISTSESDDVDDFDLDSDN